ncbi:uncharacterized protein LOC141620875 [Silene latifolia]|uniref:uncharacterized protein LOC141620875 n=1 Tax=Silene latifolia TaxID=37657 RepID=UPI003D77E370
MFVLPLCLKSRMITVNWSQLHVDLLIRIVENHLLAVDDFIVFSSVCHTWNHAARACNKLHLRKNWLRQMPWLMLTDGNDDEVYSDTGSYGEHMHDYPSDDDSYYTSSGSDDDSYYTSSGEDEDQPDEYDLLVDDDYYWNVKDGKRMLLNLSHNRNKGYSMSLYETYGKACWGSRYGWIVILGLNRRMHLFNPLTKAQLPLPSQTTLRHHWDRARDKTIRKMFLFKVVVLQVPRDEQNDNVPWLVVAIQHSYLLVAMARHGDASWMQINCHDSLLRLWTLYLCNKMKSLVFLDACGELFTYDIHNSKQPQEFKEYLHGHYIDDYYDLPNPEGIIAHAYLAQSANDMFIIVRYKRKLFGNNYLDSNHNYKTEIFKVYRCSSLATNGEEVSEIGNVALFVGGNETMCILCLGRRSE